MRTEEERFFEHLRKLLKESYWILKQKKAIPKDRKAYIDGFMLAGRIFGVGHKELKAALEDVNYEVFGMSIEERKKKFTGEPSYDEDDYQVPAYIRKGKKIEI